MLDCVQYCSYHLMKIDWLLFVSDADIVDFFLFSEINR